MDMDQAAVFFAGSVLTMLGFVVIVVGVVAINNIIYKFWKPVKIYAYHTVPRQDPELDNTNKK